MKGLRRDSIKKSMGIRNNGINKVVILLLSDKIKKRIATFSYFISPKAFVKAKITKEK